MALKHILVATDFSEPSAVAMAYGRDLARSYRARLHVLHVVEDVTVRYSTEVAFALPEIQADLVGVPGARTGAGADDHRHAILGRRDLVHNGEDGLGAAIQVLVWGTFTPFAGAIADRFGSLVVMATGSVLYCAGLILMAYSTTPGMLNLSTGVLCGLGIGATSFTLVIASFSKVMPPEWRALSFGVGTAAGSFGQFLFSPIAVGLMGQFGWHQTLRIFSAVVLCVMPLALALAAPAFAQVPGQHGKEPRAELGVGCTGRRTVGVFQVRRTRRRAVAGLLPFPCVMPSERRHGATT